MFHLPRTSPDDHEQAHEDEGAANKELDWYLSSKEETPEIAVKTNARTTNGYAFDSGMNVRIHAQSGTKKPP
jgi:hypothetical protein